MSMVVLCAKLPFSGGSLVVQPSGTQVEAEEEDPCNLYVTLHLIAGLGIQKGPRLMGPRR